MKSKPPIAVPAASHSGDARTRLSVPVTRRGQSQTANARQPSALDLLGVVQAGARASTSRYSRA